MCEEDNYYGTPSVCVWLYLFVLNLNAHKSVIQKLLSYFCIQAIKTDDYIFLLIAIHYLWLSYITIVYRQPASHIK